MIYRNTKTGVEIVTNCVCAGSNWVRVDNPAPEPKPAADPKKAAPKAKGTKKK